MIGLFHARWAYWGKNPNENIEEYVLRFRMQNMDIQSWKKKQQQQTNKELLYLFWNKIPKGERPMLDYVTPCVNI